MTQLKVGDRVTVIDPGLAMLRQLMPEQPPNNIGWVREVWEDDILVAFLLDDEEGEEHFQVAPYPKDTVVRMETR